MYILKEDSNMFYCYVLEIEKDNDKKIYVGQTKNLDDRFKKHLSDLKKNKHHNVFLQDLYNDGWKLTRIVKIYEIESRKEAMAKEKETILKNKDNPDLLNIEIGFDTYSRNPNKDQIVQKRTITQKKMFEGLSKEQRAEIYGKPGIENPMYGKNHTEATKELLSKKSKIRYLNFGSPLSGLKRSAEFKQRCSEIAQQRVGAKNPFFGRTHSLESKERIKNANLGKKPVNTIKVSIKGRIYDSLTEAGRQLGVPTPTVLWRVKSDNPRFSEWKWL